MGSIILISSILYNTNFRAEDNSNRGYNFINENFLQNSYAIETEDKDKDNDVKKQDEKNNKDSKETKEDESENNKDGKSVFNFVAVGDWDCTSETEDTVDNIIKQDPEIVLVYSISPFVRISPECGEN